ncbi:wax ester/triacylglycerol synthase family O-acyltransferase [Deltaproteobacteria bacterium TL4]
MMLIRVLSCLVGLTGLSVYLFCQQSVLMLASLGFLYIANVLLTLRLSRELKRLVPGWAVLSVLFPFLTPLILAFLAQKPEGAMDTIDVSWLHMERPTNLMMVNGIMTFESPLDYQALKTTLEKRLLSFDRFRQCVKDIHGTPYWEDVPDMNWEYHLSRVRLVSDDPEKEFHALLNQLAGTKFDFTKPLWQMHLIENYKNGSAIIVRIHHCIGDGIGLIRVLISLTDEAPSTAKKSETAGTQKTPAEVPKVQPQKGGVLPKVKFSLGILKALAKSLMLPDTKTSMKETLSGERCIAWSAPVPLQEIKDIGKQYNGKINDVVLAATAGAIRHYLEKQGESVDNVNIRVLVPINLRPVDGKIELGNRVGFVFFPLPVEIEDPVERVLEVKKRMDTIKGGQEAILSYLFLTAIGTLPQKIQHLIINTFNNNATSTMTNVPGPRETLYLGDQAIGDLVFFGPQSGNMGVGISVLSYAGNVTLGVSADSNCVRHPQDLVDGFQKDIDNWFHQLRANKSST